MKKLRLGKIGYLNVMPIYYPLETNIIPHSFEIISGIPAQLNELARTGNLDISSTSSIEYARNFSKYYLIPNLCIGSNGPVMSVLFLSKLPLHKLNGKKVILTSHSHTSVALLKMFLKSQGISVEYLTGNVMDFVNQEHIHGALAIGDEALMLRNNPHIPYIIDLGEQWKRETGLPFVFGVWVAVKQSFNKYPEKIKEGCRILIDAKNWGQKRLSFFAKIIENKKLLNYDDALTYYKGLIYDLDDNYIEGLKLFFKKLYIENLIPTMPDIDFIF